MAGCPLVAEESVAVEVDFQGERSAIAPEGAAVDGSSHPVGGSGMFKLVFVSSPGTSGVVPVPPSDGPADVDVVEGT